MLRGLTQHQANHHPLALGLVLLIFGPFLLAAALLYAVVYVIYMVLRYAVLVGQRVRELRAEQ